MSNVQIFFLYEDFTKLHVKLQLQYLKKNHE